MKKRHGSWFHNPSARGEATSLHNVESFTKFLDEFWSGQKIIAVICIAHDDELSPRGRDATHESTAIPSLSYIDNAGSKLLGDRRTSIGASVIGNDVFSVYLLFI